MASVHHEILWQGADVDVAVPLRAESAGAGIRRCGASAAARRGGFHSPDNRVRGWTRVLDLNALPKKGRLSNVEPESGRKRHPSRPRAVCTRRSESAINGLEHRWARLVSAIMDPRRLRACALP